MAFLGPPTLRIPKPFPKEAIRDLGRVREDGIGETQVIF